MEYYEIGERFEHEGVVLEVVDYNEYAEGDVREPCYMCYFCCEISICTNSVRRYCHPFDRRDLNYAYYKLVEKCKPKDMEYKKQIKVEGTDKVFATQVTNIQSDEEIYGSLLDKLFTTYKSKNADYGSAFAEMFDELGIDYAYGKLREKMNRIKVLRKQPNMVENEGLEDALLDTAGYAILTLVELKKRKDDDKSE